MSHFLPYLSGLVELYNYQQKADTTASSTNLSLCYQQCKCWQFILRLNIKGEWFSINFLRGEINEDTERGCQEEMIELSLFFKLSCEWKLVDISF